MSATCDKCEAMGKIEKTAERARSLIALGAETREWETETWRAVLVLCHAVLDEAWAICTGSWMIDFTGTGLDPATFKAELKARIDALGLDHLQEETKEEV